MQKFFTLASLLLLLTLSAAAQQYPFFTQWVFNPYTINPSMVASGRRTEANVSYRQQWTGIKDGPRTMQFDLQHPIDPRMSIGLSVYNDRTVLLSATSAMLTFGYKVPIATNHSIGFGISAGIFSNRIRQEEIANVDSNDPAILNSTANNFAFNGQFGANYSFKNLTLGFALLQLVDHQTLSEDNFQKVTFSQLKNKIAFATYRFVLVPDTWAFQPAFTYRFNENSLNLYEAAAFVSYKNILDVGGGYRQYFGANAMLRVHIKDIEIGFAYDFPTPNMQVSTGGSNEVQLKWRFGKFVDPVSRKSQKQSTTIKQDAVAQAPVTPPVEVKKEEETTDTKNTDTAATQTAVVQTAVAEPTSPEPRPSWQDHMEVDDKLPGNYYYLIVGTFKKQSNANKLVRNMAEDGVEAEVKKVQDYYYVHISKYKTKLITLDRVMEIRHQTPYADAWYKRLE